MKGIPSESCVQKEIQTFEPNIAPAVLRRRGGGLKQSQRNDCVAISHPVFKPTPFAPGVPVKGGGDIGRKLLYHAVCLRVFPPAKASNRIGLTADMTKFPTFFGRRPHQPIRRRL
jgi:hypothetical protein